MKSSSPPPESSSKETVEPEIRACMRPSGLRDAGPVLNTFPVSCTRIPSTSSPAERPLSTIVEPTWRFVIMRSVAMLMSLMSKCKNMLVYAASEASTVTVTSVQAPVSVRVEPVAGSLAPVTIGSCTSATSRARPGPQPASLHACSRNRHRPWSGTARVASVSVAITASPGWKPPPGRRQLRE